MRVRRAGLLFTVALFAAPACGGVDYDRFRSVYEDRATYEDEFRDRPPELSDEQVDEAIRRVCAAEHGLDAADNIGRTLADRSDGKFGPSTMGSAIFDAVEEVGCPDGSAPST